MTLRKIQKIFLTSLLAMSTSAFADDKLDWTGFYGSAMLGNTWGVSQNKGGALIYVNADGSADNGNTSPISDNKSSFHGVNGTIKLGYNKQIDTNLIGIELGVTLQDAKANPLTIVNLDTVNTLHTNTKVNTYETISARLGHIFNENTLIYVTGGAAVGQIKSQVSGSHNELSPFDDWLYSPYTTTTNSKAEVGYAFGFGAEHKLTDRLSLRANYEYVDFGNVNFNYSQPFGGHDGVSINQSYSIHFSNLSAGVSYAF